MLSFSLNVNRTCIGHFEARRITGIEAPQPTNTYDVRVYTSTGGRTVRSTYVNHRDDAGAWALVRAALQQLEEEGGFLD